MARFFCETKRLGAGYIRMETAIAPDRWKREHAVHLLSRACLGASPAEVNSALKSNPRQTVETLLAGDRDDDLFPVPDSIANKELYTALAERMAAVRNDPAAKDALMKEARQFDIRAAQELRGWWITRLRHSPHALRETMTLFWHGHFASGMQKVRNPRFLWAQNETFRAHALGNFAELAKEMPRDPAMMRYLDIAGSSAANPNENFARELMELFLLGEGNYSEEDIRQAARAFTGYRINPLTQTVSHIPRRADTGEKSLFGKTGNFDSDAVVDILLGRLQCAPFIAAKIWKFFAGSDPSPILAHKLGERFRGGGYEIKPLLREIFLSSEFYSPKVVGTQIKSPVQWLVGTSKSLETPLTGSRVEQDALKQLGQMLFEPPSVKGWDGGRSWISASTFINRCNLSSTLFLSRQSPDPARLFPADVRGSAESLYEAVAARMLVVRPTAKEKERLISFVNERGLPASDSTISDLLHLVMSLPEYQIT